MNILERFRRVLRGFPWQLILVIALFAGLGQLRPVIDLDTPWHLQQAQTVLENKAASYPDQTSFTVEGRQFENHPWLAQIVLYTVYNLGGFAALSCFTALCGFLIVFVIAWAAWEFSERRPWITILTTAFVVPVVSWRLHPRPLLFFLIFLPLALVLLRRYGQSKNRPLWFYGAGLLVLQLVWMHSHGSYVLLPALAAIALYPTWKQEGLPSTLKKSILPALMVLSILLFTNITEHMKLISNVALGDATKHIKEMRPMTWKQLIPGHINSIFFLDILLFLGVSRSVKRRSARPEDVAYAVLGLALTFTAHRFRAAWGLLCIPLVARSNKTEEESSLIRYFALIAALTTVPAVVMSEINRDPRRGFGPGLSQDGFPVDTSNFLKAVNVEGKLLNLYDDGGFLAFNLGPRLRIAIDGRTPTLFDDELYFLIREASRNQHAFEVFDKRYQPNMVLTKPSQAQCRFLKLDRNWRPVFVGPERTLFFRNGFRTDILGLSALDACAPQFSIQSECAKGNAKGIERDLGQMLSYVPNATYALVLFSELAGACYGDIPRAAAAAQKAVSLGTQRPSAWMAYARALAGTGEVDSAIFAAEHAIQMKGGMRAELLKAQIERRSGRKTEALKTYASIASKYLDAIPIDARLDYAEALAEDEQWALAKLQAQRVLWVKSSTRARILLERAP